MRIIVGEEAERKTEIGLAKDGSGVGGKCFSLLTNKGQVLMHGS